MNKFIVICVMFISSLAVMAEESTWRNDAKYRPMIEAIQKGDYETAYSLATFLSSAGDEKGTCMLAAMSMTASGVPLDYEVAISHLTDLASKGNLRAQYMLGGFGSVLKSRQFMKALMGEDYVPENDNSFWFQMMGTDGVACKTFSDTLEWFFAPLDDVAYRDIMFYAGLFCLNNQFDFSDPENGIMWLQKSAAQGYGDAIQLLEQLGQPTTDDSTTPGLTDDELF